MSGAWAAAESRGKRTAARRPLSRVIRSVLVASPGPFTNL
jgi:hypothetical protein